jgi:phosphohistidine phosphatase SixA
MKVYLIRHAERDRNASLPDEDQPLSLEGEQQAEALAGKLKIEGIPTLFLTSRYRHAQQTAEILRKFIYPEAPLISLDVLTPRLKAGTFNPAEVIAESKHAGQELSAHQIVAIVLHHPRQTQLAMMLKGADDGNWRSESVPGNAEAICLTAGTLDAFAEGKGVEVKRI